MWEKFDVHGVYRNTKRALLGRGIEIAQGTRLGHGERHFHFRITKREDLVVDFQIQLLEFRRLAAVAIPRAGAMMEIPFRS